MKLGRLLRTSPPASGPRTDPADPSVDARRAAGTRAVFARVIDGDSLWIAVEDAPADAGIALALDAGPRVLHDDAGPPVGGHLAVRVLLDDVGLPPEEGSCDLLVGSDARGWEPLRSAPLPDLSPACTPPTSDGRWQYDVERTDDGRLRLGRARVEPALCLASLGRDGEAIVFEVGDVEGGTPDALLDASAPGGPAGRLSGVATESGNVRYRVTLDDVPPGAEETLRVLVDAPGGPLPVRRRRNDLANPARAVVCPEVARAGRELRVRFDRRGRMLLRHPVPAGAAG